MDVAATGNVGQEYTMRVMKAAQNAAKQEGEGAVQLIEAAKAPPTGSQGQGTHINTYG